MLGGEGVNLVINGKKRTEVAGTCALDGVWGHLKKRLQGLKAGSKAVRIAKRHYQWLHWTRAEDRWELMGHIIRKAS